MKPEISGHRIRHRGRWRGALTLGLALTLAACGARTVPPPVPTAQKFPDFVYPSVPASLQAMAGASRVDLGWRYLQNGDTREAGREFAAALKSSPQLYPAKAGEGYVALARNDEAHALEAFDTALRPAPQYVPALIGRAQALLALKRDSDAVAAFEAALAVDSSLTAVQRQVDVLKFRTLEQVIDTGRTAAASGRLDQARTAYERAIQLSAESGFLYRELAAVERRQGNDDRALEHLKQAIMLDPLDAAAYVGVGDILAGRQDLEAAETAYRRAAALEPSADVSAKITALAERARELKLPAEFKAIAGAPQVTRGDLAALIALRLERAVASAPSRQVVITDTAGHWAATWITQVATAGVMDPFENHTFQPGLAVRRGDLADVASRLIRMFAANDAALRGRIAVQPQIADMPPTHLRYPAAAVATAAGVMPLLENGGFDVNRLVTGAEAQDVVNRLQALSR